MSLLSPLNLSAQNDSAKVITSSRMIGIGGTNILDTYLSAEHFKGAGMSFLATVERKRPYRRWSTLMEHEANLSLVHDRADSQKEMEGVYNFYWGKLYNWSLFNQRLTLQAGGLVNASLGFIYNTSNSNNPAQARAHLNVMPTAVASYRFTLFKKPMLVRYEVNLPLAGVMFSPNYGQSYYEIFSRGNYDHNCVFTTFVNAPEWRQILTLDANLKGSWMLRIGYLGNYQQYKVNQLKQHVYTHRLLIGFTKKFSIIPHRL
ncbi:MAG: DUF3316 domain-containing protein [Prevotella sp.]|nr:DUF3316 domain-containing protein [Prevotella sp.]